MLPPCSPPLARPRGSYFLMGDAPYTFEDDTAGSRLQSILDLVVKYSQDGVMRLHLGPWRTIVVLTNPDYVRARTAVPRSRCALPRLDRALATAPVWPPPPRR